MVEPPKTHVSISEEDMQAFIQQLVHVKSQIEKYPWLKKIVKNTL